MERAQGGRQGERELGAGAEPRMGRNRFLHRHMMGARKPERALHHLQARAHTFLLRSEDGAMASRPHGQARSRRIDREPDAAEAAPKPAIEIEEAEMQARWRGDDDTIGAHREHGHLLPFLVRA
jgi:hypothetical protein